MKKQSVFTLVGALILGASLGGLGVQNHRLNSIVEEKNKEIIILRENNARLVTLEEKSLDGKKWYLLDLEGKIQPENYNLRTEESDVCSMIADNVRIKPGTYKFMFIESVNQEKKPQDNYVPLNR